MGLIYISLMISDITYLLMNLLAMSMSSLEKGMAIHSSILAWRIPWTEEPSEPPSMGLQRVGHDWVTNDVFFGKMSIQICPFLNWIIFFLDLYEFFINPS